MVRASPLSIVCDETAAKRISYVGNIGFNRGIFEMILALGFCKNKVCLDVCGKFSEKETELSAKAQTYWKYVNFHGWVSDSEVRRILSKSIAGIVVLKATPNYLYSLPVKMFEYMQAGIPVVASDFSEWRNPKI